MITRNSNYENMTILGL